MSDFPNGILANQTVISTIGPNAMGAETVSGGGVLASAAWQVANTGVFIPVRIFEAVTVVKMGVVVGTSNTGLVDVGIYDPAGNRLVRAGSTSLGTTSSIQTFDVTDTYLNPGLYYFAAACSSTSGSLFGFAITNVMLRACGVFTVASAFSSGLITPVTYAAANSSVTRTYGIFAFTNTVI